MYGPTRDAATDLLVPLGVNAEFYEPRVGGGIAKALKRETRLVWLESPGSLTMEMQDLRAIAKAARKAGALSAMDNTWATPLHCRPLDHGIDFSVQALTKHIGGHSDLLLGSVAVRDPKLFRRLRDMQGLLGTGASPDECSLALRGLDTLAVRLARQTASAMEIAGWLARQPQVARVLHPCLKSDPGHALWMRDCEGAGAVFSLILKDRSWAATRRLVDGLRLFHIGASWGAVQSVVAAYRGQPARAFAGRGPTSPIVRLSIGLEDPADLIADLRVALQKRNQS
jgi:cystathionine beta-lyase